MSRLQSFARETLEVPKTGLTLNPDINICQSDYPLDWYQAELMPYAQEYQALPDRKPATVLRWMRQYMDPALDYFGDKILLLAHYYMGGEIVKLVEQFGGQVADSYQLALMAQEHPEKKIIVESAVHFMAETISILSKPGQAVYITNPKSGCTMEMNAKDFMVEPAFSALSERYGHQKILPVCYMNTSGRIKALTGEFDGAVCTSSNVKKIFLWALKQKKKLFFIPDQHMGENVASWVGIHPNKIAYWPGGVEGSQFNLHDLSEKNTKAFDEAELVLFGSSCSVHTYMTRKMVEFWKNKDFTVVVHPECRKEAVDAADDCGSTAFLWRYVLENKGKTKKYAVGTEGHFVNNLKEACRHKGIEVVHVGDAEIDGKPAMGCGCATMSRNDPPHLAGLLDLLKKGKAPDLNRVCPGDVVDERTARRERLSLEGQEWLKKNAQKALNRMIEITKG